MPDQLMLDAGAARSLADIDPALSRLADALPSLSPRDGYQLHDVRWKPGEGCQLAYRVLRPGAPPRFLAVTLSPAGWSRRDHSEDTGLAGLQAASDPATVRRRLATTLGRRIRRVRVQPVRYRPGRRCVLRYDVETAGTLSTFYAKVLRPETFAHVAPLASAVARSPEGAGLTPQLVAAWPDLHMLVTAGLHGPTAGVALTDPGLSDVTRARLAYRLGDLLGAFHGIETVDASRVSGPDQLRSLRDAADALSHVNPGLWARVDRLLDRLAATVPAGRPEVLIHGSFRAGQVVMCHDGRLRVLDLDGVCLADQARDLGTVLAHLYWLSVRQPRYRAVLAEVERGLLSGYESRTGALDREALRWWRAIGLLQVAVRRYRRVEIANWQSVPALVEKAAKLIEAHESHHGAGPRADLLDISRMSSLLPRALDEPSTLSQPVEIEAAHRLSVAPGRRVVVRYRVRGLDGQRTALIVGKAFTDPRRAHLLHQRLCLLHDGPFGDGDLRVPEPLGILPEQRLVLYRHCDGVALDHVVEATHAEEGVRRAAEWLARMHLSGLQLTRTFSLDEEERSTREWATLIGRVHSGLARRAGLVAERWSAAARSTAVEVQVPIHKDFHAGHVLVGDHLYVVDLDESRQGDPAFDLAHFCTYLTASHNLGALASLRTAFLTQYAAATGWQDTGSYRSFCAYAWLKIAKQLAVGSGPVRAASPSAGRSEAEHALTEAERCLSG